MSARVLIVEDEALLAIDLASVLEDAGFEVVGPATSVTQALKLVDGPGCDFAILDVNLHDETSEMVAVALRKQGTPFVFLTGISKDHALSWFGDVTILAKPARSETIIDAVQRRMSVGQARDT